MFIRARVTLMEELAPAHPPYPAPGPLRIALAPGNAAKSRRLASSRPAARARLSVQKVAKRRPSTVTLQRSLSSRSMETVCLPTETVVRAGLIVIT